VVKEGGPGHFGKDETMSEFTEGPWRWGYWKHRVTSEFMPSDGTCDEDFGGLMLATNKYGHGDRYDRSNTDILRAALVSDDEATIDVEDSDMRLIAQSPEMYELLEAIRKYFAHGQPGDEAVDKMFLARISAIRQAVEGSNDAQEA